MNVLKLTVPSVLALAGAVLACTCAQAAPACDSVSPIARRIVERADGDVGALRVFVWRIAPIYGVDMVDVSEKLEQWRAAVECRKQMAAADGAGAPTVVAQR